VQVVRGFDEQVDIDVVLLQRRLQLVMGEGCVSADGVYGPRTRAAVEAFVKAQGLSSSALNGELPPRRAQPPDLGAIAALTPGSPRQPPP
jgi:peptidoglycan hydrolase-like protein with peptidoglycan-binding domain